MKTIITIIIIAFTFSCTVQKDRKAVRRVKANIDLLNQTGVEWLKIHPCANETSVLILRDTLTTVKTDTIKYKGVPDTIKIETIKTITYTDTIKKTVIDGQMVKILTDSLNAEKRKGSFKDGQIIEKVKQIKEHGKKITWLWIVISLLISGIGIGMFLKIKKTLKI